jgi:hypothetical protein
MVKGRKGRGSPRGRWRRGPGGSGVDGEVAPVILGGDGVHDDVQEITARMMARSKISEVSWNSNDIRPELDGVTAMFWVRR